MDQGVVVAAAVVVVGAIVVATVVVVGAIVVAAAVVVGAIVVAAAVVVGAVVVSAAVVVGAVVVVVLFLAPPVVSTTTETDTPTKKITNTVAKMPPPITIGILFLFQLIPDSAAAGIPLTRVTDIFKALTS